MKCTKYKFTKEIIIPKENKYHLSEIVNYITDIYDRVSNPFTSIEKSYYDIGYDLLYKTFFYLHYTPYQVEITVPIKQYVKDNILLYDFNLQFKVRIDDKKELNIVKEEYKKRIEKWMYEKLYYNNVEEKEIEV